MTLPAKRKLAGLVAGAIFGAGLAVSQMVNPVKVQAFLDIAGDWDPSLLLTMGSAVLVTMFFYRRVLRKAQPLWDIKFYLPLKTRADQKLILGSAMFGTGWGLVGFCPGPAIAALTFFSWEAPAFVLSMLVGMLGYDLIFSRATA
ncbi:MAG: YeeE/YedE family protein [Proteobacteria bacterium]|nr:YeeE/YedE family protein [Pseudomonadota bacterium]